MAYRDGTAVVIRRLYATWAVIRFHWDHRHCGVREVRVTGGLAGYWCDSHETGIASCPF